MKKYAILFCATAILLAGIWRLGRVYAREEMHVPVFLVETVQTNETVTAAGTVERVLTKQVFPGTAGIIRNLSVKTGSSVSAGQIMLEIEPYTDLTAETAIQKKYEALYSASLPAGSELEDPQENTVLRAPIDGTIVSLSVSENEYISPTQAVMTIAGEKGLQLRLQVSENKISKLAVGQSARITGEGFKDTTYTGSVTFIGNEAKQSLTSSGQEAVVEVLVDIQEDEGGVGPIKPGFTAQCEIITKEDTAWIVPYEAVQADANGQEYVFVVEDGMAKARPVVSGKEYSYGIQIEEGIEEGDLLAVSDLLTEGCVVQEGERLVLSDD